MGPDVDAWLYGLIHRGNAGDVAHYRRACRGAGSVLELGCGDARVLVALACDGLEAWGLELDDGRVRAAEARLGAAVPPSRARVMAGDMRDFDLDRRFERVLIPYSGLWALGGLDGVRRCLRCTRAHLAPAGTMHLDVWNVARAEVPEAVDKDVAPRRLTTIEADGVRVDVFEDDLWDPATQRVDARYRFVVGSGRNRTTHERMLSHHYLFADQLDGVLADCGLAVLERAGGFHGERFSPNSPVLVLTCGTAPRPS